MSDKLSKTRRIANAVNPEGGGGKFFLSTDSDAVLFGNRNNTSLKFGKLNVGRANMNGQGQVDTQVFERTSRGVFHPLLNRPDSDLFNRFTSTNLPLNDSENAYQAAYFQPQLKKAGFTDAILGSDSDTTTSFNGTYFFVGEAGTFPSASSYGNSKLHGKFPLDSDTIFANGTNITNDFLVKKKISRFNSRGNVIFGRKQGGQTINIARVSGETTPIQFGYARTAGNVHDSENTVFTSFGTLDLQGRVIFKSTDVLFGFMGSDSDSDSGFYLERFNSDGSYDAPGGGQTRNNMNAQNEQAMSSFIQPKQVVGKSYVRFLNSTSSPLTGTGTFKMFPLYDSDGDASTAFAQGRARRPVMTVTGNIADSDGTMNVRRTDLSSNDNDKFIIDSDGLTLAGQKVTIPSKYNLTVINAAGSTVATFKFMDPS